VPPPWTRRARGSRPGPPPFSAGAFIRLPHPHSPLPDPTTPPGGPCGEWLREPGRQQLCECASQNSAQAAVWRPCTSNPAGLVSQQLTRTPHLAAHTLEELPSINRKSSRFAIAAPATVPLEVSHKRRPHVRARWLQKRSSKSSAPAEALQHKNRFFCGQCFPSKKKTARRGPPSRSLLVLVTRPSQSRPPFPTLVAQPLSQLLRVGAPRAPCREGRGLDLTAAALAKSCTVTPRLRSVLGTQNKRRPFRCLSPRAPRATWMLAQRIGPTPRRPNRHLDAPWRACKRRPTR